MEYPPEVLNRFWSKVDKTPGLGPKGDCWEWRGATWESGYGVFREPGTRTNIGAHRFAFAVQFGKLDPSLDVCHTCDNPPCVRGEHLFQGTRLANLADMTSKGRRVVWHPNGELNPAAKITDAQVKELLDLFRTGIPREYLARQFGIGRNRVAQLVRAAGLSEGRGHYAR